MSLASMNPFSSKTSETIITEKPSQLASTNDKVAAGTTPASKNVFQKTSSKITGMFGGKKTPEPDDDPLSLANAPEQMEPDVYVANGQLWESTGNLTKAMESYAKALETSPDHEPALTSIARLHFREGNYPKSAEFFQKSIAQKPDDAALFNDLGLTLSKLGQHDMAAQTLQRALQIAPGTSRYANNLASVYFESGKPDKALEALKANNKPAVAHFNMAFLHYKKGQTTEAQSQLTQSLAYEKESASDPATKRAIDRSREMLAQLNPSGAMPAGIGPAAGPIASIAAAPAHKSNQSAQVLGQHTIEPMTPQAKPMATTGEPQNAYPVSYQNPRSYMSPTPPPGPTPTAPATTQINVPAFARPGATTPVSLPPIGNAAPNAAQAVPPSWSSPPAKTNPATQPSTSGFSLPGNFQLPNK